MSEHPGVPGHAQTPAPDAGMNAIGTLTGVPAGEGASPLIPPQEQFHQMNESGSLSGVPASEGATRLIPIQQFQQMEARWYHRYKELAEKCETDRFVRLQECQSEWRQRYEEAQHEIQEKSAEIASLIVAVLYEKKERLKLERKFNVCGALELIACHATITKRIGSHYALGIQDCIDELAKTPAFVEALKDEVAAYKLAPEDATACIGNIYNTVSNLNGNDPIITLYENHHTKAECAVLATLLKIQSRWPNGFEWAKVERRRTRPDAGEATTTTITGTKFRRRPTGGGRGGRGDKK